MSDPTSNPPPADDRATGPVPPPSTPPPWTPPPPGYQPVPPPPYGLGGVGQPASLTDRFLARLIDYLLLAVVNLVLVSSLIVGVIMGSSANLFAVGTSESALAGAVSSLLSAAIYLGYFSLMESTSGQTVGKMVTRLRTQGPDGGNPTLEQAIKRNAFVAIGVIGVIPVVGGLVSGLASLVAVVTIAVTITNNTATRQGWHDNFAGGTSVVKGG